MSFRRRNVPLSGAQRSITGPLRDDVETSRPPGVRPSPLDGRSVISTGTASLDGLLAGHGGLALGCSLLIEEDGTTDYAGALIKFFAAEGLLQGHHVHAIGLPETWGRELPGALNDTDKHGKSADVGDKMKIAWRYESLGLFGQNTSSRDGSREMSSPISAEPSSSVKSVPFNHNFDLTKRLVHPASANISFYQLDSNPSQSPFVKIVGKLSSAITASPPDTLHRLVLPSLLSPALFPPHASHPAHLLPFLHRLRSLLSTNRLTIMASLPISLHSRSAGLTRFIELLHDGVLELSPFPHSAISVTQPLNANSNDEPPQGILRIHKLPILHERGSGMAGYEEDWTFSLSRRTLRIKPFNLPPVEGDQEAQEAALSDGKDGKAKKGDMEF